jgi:hypothetical protein
MSARAGVSVPSHVPGIVLRRPNGIKGAAGVAEAMAQSATLDPAEPTQRLAGCEGTGTSRASPSRGTRNLELLFVPVFSCGPPRRRATLRGTAVHPESSAGEGHAPVGNQCPVFDLVLYPFSHLDHVSGVEELDPVGASCGGPRRRIGSLASCCDVQTRGVAVERAI